MQVAQGLSVWWPAGPGGATRLSSSLASDLGRLYSRVGSHSQKITIAKVDVAPLATATANRSGASRSNETLFAQSDKSTPIAQRHSPEDSIEPETADGPRPRQAMPGNH